MQHAADQRLIRNSLLQSARADGLQIATGEADVDALILVASGMCRLLQIIQQFSSRNAAQCIGLEIMKELLLFGIELEQGVLL